VAKRCYFPGRLRFTTHICAADPVDVYQEPYTAGWGIGVAPFSQDGVTGGFSKRRSLPMRQVGNQAGINDQPVTVDSQPV
jgi:hypothetical protein